MFVALLVPVLNSSLTLIPELRAALALAKCSAEAGPASELESRLLFSPWFSAGCHIWKIDCPKLEFHISGLY